MKLSQNEKRLKIAETLGFTGIFQEKNGQFYGHFSGDIDYIIDEHRELVNFYHLPFYFDDLNACMDFKKFLSGDQIVDFINILYNLTFIPNSLDRDYGIVFAEAKHYCEAFGRALKLWKENE